MKPLFITINTLLVICIAYLGTQLIYKQTGKGTSEKMALSGIENLQFYPIFDPEKSSLKDDYQKIKSRNLFNVDTGFKKTAARNAASQNIPLKPIKLDLILWGTVLGSIHTYAVIEDKQTKNQALYQIGDVIQNATIKQILRDSVVLRYNNQDYVLRSNLLQSPTQPKKKTARTNRIKQPTVQTIPVKASTIMSSLGNIENLKRQISIKPIVNNGKSEGLLVYRIRPNSFFHNLGLRNGDIVKQVNGDTVTSKEEAIKIYQGMQASEQFKVLLMRKGKEQEIIYQLTPDKGSN